MFIVRTAKGTEIQCESVIRSRQYPVIHIYTHDITPVQAWQIFDDSEATSELYVIEEKIIPIQLEDGSYSEQVVHSEKTYKGFTVLHSVQRAPFYQDDGENELLIWLQKAPEPDE